MKLKKLLAKAEAVFDAGQRGRTQKQKHLKKVLKKLRSHEEALSTRLHEETDQAVIKKLKRKVSLVHAQRKKGLMLIQELSEGEKSKD